MNATFSLLLAFLVQFFLPRHNAQLRLLKAQIAILRSRIPVGRLILSPAEKSELLRIGAECGHDVDGMMEVAKPATYKRWLAQMRGGRPFQSVGRPRLTQELRDVVIRIGSENLLWGYKRIAGELKKPGLYAGANSVKRILNDAGIHPSPERRRKQPALPWTTFVRAHLESLVACDFFTKSARIVGGASATTCCRSNSAPPRPVPRPWCKGDHGRGGRAASISAPQRSAGSHHGRIEGSRPRGIARGRGRSTAPAPIGPRHRARA